jgi:hypothetical protein
VSPAPAPPGLRSTCFKHYKIPNHIRNLTNQKKELHTIHSGGESSDNDRPADSRLQSSTYPSSRVKGKSKTWSLTNPKLGVLKTNSKTRKDGPSRLSDDDDKDSSSSPEDSSKMSKDSSKEWIFHGIVEILHTMDWDRSDVAEDRRMLAESLKEAFTDFGPTIQSIFSDHAPASVDYAVIVSNIYEANDDQRGNERMMGVPIRGYLATATRVHDSTLKGMGGIKYFV